MSMNTRLELRTKAVRLADLIARAKPAKIRFSSEEQFLQMLGLPQNVVAGRPSCLNIIPTMAGAEAESGVLRLRVR